MHPKHTEASPRTGERQYLTGEQRPQRDPLRVHVELWSGDPRALAKAIAREQKLRGGLR